MKTLVHFLLLEMRRLRPWEFKVSTLLVIISAIAEIITIGMIFPLVAMFDQKQTALNNTIHNKVESITGIQLNSEHLSLFIIAFVFSYAVASLIRILTIQISSKLAYGLASDLTKRVYANIIYSPYEFHIKTNSSDVLNSLVKKASHFSTFFLALVNLLSYSFILIAILLFLILIKPIETIFLSTFFGMFYFSLIKKTRSIVHRDSREIADQSRNLIKLVQESIGSIRDIIVDRSQTYFINEFYSANVKMRNAQIRNILISSAPKIAVEFLGLILISAYFLLQIYSGAQLSSTIPNVLVFVVSAQRMIPAISQIYSSIASIRSCYNSVNDILGFCSAVTPKFKYSKPLSFKKKIQLNKISFGYDGKDKQILNDINLTIQPGQRIAILGRSGSGKSTFVNILMGLLRPTSGEISIDGVSVTSKNIDSWYAMIGHVPQSIYLADLTIYENVAFGVPLNMIDKSEVERACVKSLIDDYIQMLPNGYMTRVGERGVRFSGGQIQRIAIARALYKKRSLLILDEFTSALDNNTEKDLIDVIDGLEKNIAVVIVTHRPSLLSVCSTLYEMDSNGRLIKMLKKGKSINPDV